MPELGFELRALILEANTLPTRLIRLLWFSIIITGNKKSKKYDTIYIPDSPQPRSVENCETELTNYEKSFKEACSTCFSVTVHPGSSCDDQLLSFPWFKWNLVSTGTAFTCSVTMGRDNQSYHSDLTQLYVVSTDWFVVGKVRVF